MRTNLLKLCISFALSVVVTYTLASVAHSQQVLAGLLNLDVRISLTDRIVMVAGDWLGLYLYLLVIAIGLLIAFTVMALLRRFVSVPGTLLYTVGGTLAMLVILISMRELGSLTPIAGARGALGLSLQCLAGAIGGAVFGASLGQSPREPRAASSNVTLPLRDLL
ncbi:hypothetical protein [Granulosicoccus antarcticus]|uniref:Uncharacterized protein n=1 Tax=Granulosicoccus antarcticus IMCC3135 TaxID=1192854 RepID=A0A2Z2NI23_9GAMM|nr:hypothetical protein [Granulosicoccus antarcticus]ASJ70703.1 hypothetical protein IMCC3135_02950 [Granulosicoccus antarcticus IMCC3135]